ncbi:hypothetical protein [Sphingomonas xinjiangensis]|uniref:Uncharacterized protein n=1 Tax=Sphingomonas xinjiangensis TaxID=643568 RepID=A0A840YFN7_9SPHN|nr:hypothetical protein [Sphingomonas xinjiangensis]MBB5710789.1 hypothetical protein [Sphingomonas xinjiangensis]
MHNETDMAIVTHGWTPMPRPNRHLTAMAKAVARLARPLLPDESGLLMGLELNASDSLRLIWWKRDDLSVVAQINAQPEGFCPADTEEGALQEAAFDLLEYLGGRWPNPPETLGVITDGTGVAFSSDHPQPSASGWLMRHVGGAAPLLAIVPLDSQGSCALLACPATGGFH